MSVPLSRKPLLAAAALACACAVFSLGVGPLAASRASASGTLHTTSQAETLPSRETSEAAIVLEALAVTPESPTAATLCRLALRIRNRGQQAVYAFRFTVTIGDTALPVYRDQLFLRPIAAGESAELRLFNFWTSETGRPPPSDGKLRVRVSLEEARWLAIEIEGEGDDAVETWRPLEPVSGLPIAIEKTIELR